MRNVVIAATLSIGAILGDAQAEPVWVQVRESVVRSAPKYYAAGVLPVRYGEKVERLSESAGWAYVKVRNIQGYLPLSAVSLDRIVLQARELGQMSADTSDVILAGKGFNKEVEKAYKSTDPEARFDLVDKVEQASKVSSTEVAQFRKAGDLP